MSGLQNVNPTAQGLIRAAVASGKDCSYSKKTRNLTGQVVESVTIEVIEGAVFVSECDRRQAGLVDWLAVVGGVAIIFFGAWLFFQGIKGVLKSENTIRHEFVGAAAEWRGDRGMDG
jgi:hypothetical protein